MRYESLKVLKDFFNNPMMVFLSCTLFVKEGSFLDDASIVEVRSTKKIGDLQLAFLVYGSIERLPDRKRKLLRNSQTFWVIYVYPKDHWTLKTGVISRTYTPLRHTGSFILSLEGPRSLR